MENRVVLAGACIASAIGNTPEHALEALRRGRSGIVPVDGYLHTAALLDEDGPPDAELHPRISPRFSSALNGFCGRLSSLAAAAEAPERVLLICKIPFFSKFQHPLLNDWDEHAFVRRVLERGRVRVAPEQVVLLQAACSTGMVALNLAVRELSRGDATNLLLLGIESEVTSEKFLAYKKLGVLSHESDPRRSCQPFSVARSGLVPGEAAVALWLQRKATADPGDIVLTAGHTTADAFRLTDGLESGEFLSRCLYKTLGGVALDSVDFVCPHGTSTPLNDKIEGEVLNRLFADRSEPVPVVPLKQYVGHTLNSSGLLETALCAELLRDDLLPPILNPDPLEGYPHLRFVRSGEARPLRRALKVSIGFGGLNSALLLEKVR